jgi:hypothetical protein
MLSLGLVLPFLLADDVCGDGGPRLRTSKPGTTIHAVLARVELSNLILTR